MGKFLHVLWPNRTEELKSDTFLSLRFVNFDWDCMAISCMTEIVMISVTFSYPLLVI